MFICQYRPRGIPGCISIYLHKMSFRKYINNIFIEYLEMRIQLNIYNWMVWDYNMNIAFVLGINIFKIQSLIIIIYLKYT